MRLAFLRWFNENFDDLLNLDLKIARILGAPAPHTISSYAHVKWKWLEPIIDFLAKWLLHQENHCLTDYKRVVQSAEQQSPKL